VRSESQGKERHETDKTRKNAPERKDFADNPGSFSHGKSDKKKARQEPGRHNSTKQRDQTKAPKVPQHWKLIRRCNRTEHEERCSQKSKTERAPKQRSAAAR